MGSGATASPRACPAYEACLRNLSGYQTVGLKQRLANRGVTTEELVISDNIHGVPLHRTWTTVTTAAGEFVDRKLMKGTSASQR